MKRCTKTMSGKHIWQFDYRNFKLFPICLACGLIDDRPKKKENKKKRSK